MSSDFSSYLGRGEIVRWSGQPKQGLVLRAEDVVMIPFSLVWAGFAVFWEANAVMSGGWFMILWGIPFIGIGLYIVVGRFFFDAFIRSRTRYALTDHRALILGGFTGKQLTEVDLRSTSQIGFRLLDGSRGTISFGPEPTLSARIASRTSTRSAPEFFRIDNAANVYKLITAARSLKP